MTNRRNNISRISSIRKVTASSSPSGVTRKVTSANEPAESRDEDVEKQVAAIKKLPKDSIAVDKTEKKLTEVNSRLQEVIAENTKLASAVRSASQETESLRIKVKQAQEETARSEKLRTDTENKLQALLLEIQDLKSQIAESEEKESREEAFIVNPDRIGTMITDFESSLSTSFSGMTVSNIELRLKVAVISKKNHDDIMILPYLEKAEIDGNNLSELFIRAIPSTIQMKSLSS